MLNEFLDDYKESDEQQKDKLLNEFNNRLCKSDNTYKTNKKYYTYIVKDELLQHRTDLIELFNKYSIVEYSVCRSFYDRQLTPFDYIRIHINNMYGYLTDKNVYLSKEYYQLLLIPKHEYFSTIDKLKNGELVDYEEVENRIINAFDEAEKVKQQSIEKKLNLTFKEYKMLINSYISRLFINYIPLHEYEEKHGWEMHVNVDGWSEDNYIVKYFCKSLTGYLRNYIKSLSIKDKKCITCDIAIESTSNRQKYCDKCKKEIVRMQTRLRVNKFRDVTH